MQIISYFLLLAWRKGQTDNKQGLGEKGNLREKKMKKNNPILLTWDMMSCLAACCRCLSRMSPANTSPDWSIIRMKDCDWSINYSLGTTSRSLKNSDSSRAISAKELCEDIFG